MKKMKFIVENETIKRDPSSDTVHRGDEEVRAEFIFSKEWNRMVKVVKFTRGNDEFSPQLLKRGSSCYIPIEALDGSFFRMSVLGKREGMTMKTNTIIVYL